MNQESRDELVTELALSGNLFTQDHIAAGVKTIEGALYVKRDFLFKYGDWRGKRQRPAFLQRNISLLAVGHSDYSISRRHISALRLAMGGRNLQVWASNLSSRLRRVRSFPIGLTNKFLDSPNHQIFGNQTHIASALEAKRFSRRGLYANFSSTTAPKYRNALRSFMLSNSIGAVRDPVVSDAGRVRYLSEMREYGFVVCPRGNGIDTCRLFEALAVGAVPVLKRDEAPLWLHEYPDLPLIFLDSWRELLGLEARVSSLEFVPTMTEFLSASHWLEKLRRDAALHPQASNLR